VTKLLSFCCSIEGSKGRPVPTVINVPVRH